MASKEQREPGQGEAHQRRPPPPPRDVAQDDVGESSAESFPASDAPSWTGMIAGPPDRSDATDAQRPD